MSWCEATPTTRPTIALAQYLRRHHVPKKTWRGKRCNDCGKSWRRHGCRDYLWATDYLSRLSRIVLHDRPDRPKPGRHRPSYTDPLREYAEIAEQLLATQTTQTARTGRPVPEPAPGRTHRNRTAPATPATTQPRTTGHQTTPRPTPRHTTTVAAPNREPVLASASASVPRHPREPAPPPTRPRTLTPERAPAPAPATRTPAAPRRDVAALTRRDDPGPTLGQALAAALPTLTHQTAPTHGAEFRQQPATGPAHATERHTLRHHEKPPTGNRETKPRHRDETPAPPRPEQTPRQLQRARTGHDLPKKRQPVAATPTPRHGSNGFGVPMQWRLNA